MHIKHMHEMIEKLTDCTKSAIENDQVSVGQYPIADVVDMIKDLNEASYYASIVKAMEEAKKEDEEEDRYMLRMLKEENKDEYRRYQEEYGEDADRRFYDNYRYKRTGEFAPKGRGSYMPRRSGRRGYAEPPYLHIPYDYRYDMDDYDYADAERNRDLDRRSMNRLYFSEPMRSMDMDGRYPGRRDGDMRPESRYDRARRGYEEVKSAHKGNTPEDKQLTMREMEKVLGVVFDEIDEMLEDASPEMKNMVKTKTMSRMQKIQ